MDYRYIEGLADMLCSERKTSGFMRQSLKALRSSKIKQRTSITNEANLTGGESIGGSASQTAAPAEAGSDDDGGDPDPEPERQKKTRRTIATPRSTITPAFARPRDACAYLRVSRTKLHTLSESDPKFPRKIVFSARCVGWLFSDLDAYLKAKSKELFPSTAKAK